MPVLLSGESRSAKFYTLENRSALNHYFGCVVVTFVDDDGYELRFWPTGITSAGEVKGRWLLNGMRPAAGPTTTPLEQGLIDLATTVSPSPAS